MRARLNRWLDSDLVGVAATIYSFGVLVISLALFRYASPLAGIVVAVGLWIPMFVFAIRERGYPPAPLTLAPPDGGRLHRVLVIANQGLDDPAVWEEICRHRGLDGTEAMICAPVVASSRLHYLANDIDAELDLAGRRVDAALLALQTAGLRARGRTDIAGPRESLLDGLREFPANEVLMLSGREGDWGAARAMAERVSSEMGLRVTEVSRERDPVSS